MPAEEMTWPCGMCSHHKVAEPAAAAQKSVASNAGVNEAGRKIRRDGNMPGL